MRGDGLPEALFLVLLALNHAYFSTYKWMYPILETLALKPEQLDRRLRRQLTLPPMEATAQLHSVLAETLSLVEERYPQVDTNFAHYCLDQTPHSLKTINSSGLNEKRIMEV